MLEDAGALAGIQGCFVAHGTHQAFSCIFLEKTGKNSRFSGYDQNMSRIVSLIASATEIVCALGMEEHLVGRSHECDYPESVKRLPVCTEPKFDIHGSSAEIDGRVKSVLADATSVYRVHADVLRELRPDVIITQTQCEVCAVSQRDVELALGAWLENKPRVVSLEPNALADVWTDIQRVADSLGIAERGKELISQLQNRLAEIGKRIQGALRRPTVACLEWIDPLMAAGNWMPELVDLAGGHNLFGCAGQHSPVMKWDQLCAKNPDVIVAMPCGLDLARTRQEMSGLVQKSEWGNLEAVRSRQVYVTDGNQYFNRPGPRLVESAEILAEIFHPDVASYEHEGGGWQRFEINAK
jgi:iron complex transport system substrate-binding protein